MTEITATREQELEALAPHDEGCKDWALELIVEAAAAKGVELVGDINETWNGMANAERAHMWMSNGTIECHCERAPEGFTGRRAYPEPEEV